MKRRDHAPNTILRKRLCALHITLYTTVAGVAFVPHPMPAEESGLLKSGFIYATNTVPFPECHASTIAETLGHLVAAWFGGTREGARDVGIWSSRLENGTWTPPKEVADGKSPEGAREPCWNPVLFQPSHGPLLLFYKVGPNPRQWHGVLKTSQDGGLTWSAPGALPSGFLGPIKNKPVQLPTGDIICPSSTEHDGWKIHFERTSDLGKTWHKTEPLNDGKEFAAIQPSILSLGQGRLESVGRTRQGKIFQIWSEDDGNTWSKMSATQLPNPNSGIDAVTLKNQTHLLVYNHTSKGRSPLNVAVSNDGKTWQAAVVLENTPGEYSYPAVIQTTDGLIHVTYTWNRKCIKHAVLNAEKLQPKPMDDGIWPK